MGLIALSRPQFETPLRIDPEMGPQGRLCWVRPDQLAIDEDYQRPVMASGKKNIRAMAEQLRHAKFSPLMLSERGGARYALVDGACHAVEGLFAIIDGQHHAIAAALRGDVPLFPAIAFALTPEEEADAFGTINGAITRVHPLHVFRARLAAGDRPARLLARVAAESGVSICRYPKTGLAAGETMAIGTLESCLARYGAEALGAALRLVTQTGNGNPGFLRQEIIRGGADVLFRHPKWRAARGLIKAVDAVGLPAIAARGHRRAGGSGFSRFAAALAGVLAAALGDGGQIAARTLTEAARSGARKGHQPASLQQANAARTQAALQREQGVIAAAARSAPAAAADTPVTDLQALAAAHAAKGGVRRFESGATGYFMNLLDWLTRIGIEARYLGPKMKPRNFEIAGKRVDQAGMLAIVNRERKKRKLEPITAEG